MLAADGLGQQRKGALHVVGSFMNPAPEVLLEAHFCTCTDSKCRLNPKNESCKNKVCDYCIKKCLRAGEIPACFFKPFTPTLRARRLYLYWVCRLSGEAQQVALRNTVKPSETAQFAAAHRAYHLMHDRPAILEDSAAIWLLGPPLDAILRVRLLRWLFWRPFSPRSGRQRFIVVRSRYAEIAWSMPLAPAAAST